MLIEDKRITPLPVTFLRENEVYVFESNEGGRHLDLQARRALDWGAKWDVGSGLKGRTYAIPLKDSYLKELPIIKVEKYIEEFINFARRNQNLTFYVTEIGGTLKEVYIQRVKKAFSRASEDKNIYLPESFLEKN